MTPTKEKALAALLACHTKQEAAQQAGIAERTLRSYLQDEEFQRAYRAACDDLLEAAAMQTRQALTSAIDALQEIVKDPCTPAAVKVSAARAIIENCLKLTETVDLVRRVQAVEDKAYGEMEWR